MHEAISAVALLCKATEELVVGVPLTLSHIQLRASFTLTIPSITVSADQHFMKHLCFLHPHCYPCHFASFPTGQR